MARPIKQGMDYFPHDTDSCSDEKIDILRTLYGNDGYAFYFIMLERIYRTPEFELEVSDAETIQILAKKVEVTVQKFEEMLQTSIRKKLFDAESFKERGVLTSNGIKNRAAGVVNKRQKMASAYQKKVSDAETHQKPDKVKESKVKKSKVNSKLTHVDADASGDSNINPLTLLKNLFILKTPGYYWQGKDAKNGTELLQKMRHQVAQKSGKEPNDQDVLSAIGILLDQRKRLSPRFQTADVCILNADFNKIMEELNIKKNGHSVSNPVMSHPLKTGVPD